MMPSAACTISLRCARAWGFSILAITGMDDSQSPVHKLARRALSSSTSSGERTNERARKSSPCSTAQSTQIQSRSVSAGAVMSLSGRLMPLPEVMIPPTVTLHRSSSSVASIASMRMAPSLMSTRWPGRTSRTSPSYVVGKAQTCSPVASVSSKASSSPHLKTTTRPAGASIPPSGTRPTRILGP